MLTNSPLDVTVIEAEARKSFSFGMWIVDSNRSPVDITDTSTTFTVAKFDKFGVPTVLVSKVAAIQAPTLGYSVVAVQADELDLKPGTYDFTTTLRIQGYSVVLMKGEFKVLQNSEFESVNEDYIVNNPSQNLQVVLRDQLQVHIELSTMLPPNLVTPTDASDAAVAGYFNNPLSLTRGVADGLYASKVTTTSALNSLDARLDTAETDIDNLQLGVTTLSTDLAMEELDRVAGDNALDVRVDNLELNAASGGSKVFPGMMAPYGGSVAPFGYLLCDGSAVSRTTYSALFAAIGTLYGAGNGTTTFNLPNIKGRTLIGLDGSQTEFNLLGKTGGAKTHRHDFKFGLFDNQWMPSGSYAGMEAASQANDLDRMGAFRYSTGKYSGATGPGVSASALATNSATNAGTAITKQLNREETVGDTDVPTGTTGLPPFTVANWIISYGEAPATTVISNPRGTTAQRDGTFGIPVTVAQQVALANQMQVWYNTESGWYESYYATTGLSGLTAKGLLAGIPSGWYPLGDGPEISLVAGAQLSMTAGMTYTNWAAPGTGKSWRKGGTAWFTYASGVIAMPIPGRYMVSCRFSVQQGSGSGRVFLSRNNSSSDPNVLSQQIINLDATYDTMYDMTVPSVYFAANDNVRFIAPNVGSAIFFQTADGQKERIGTLVVKYLGPALVTD